MLNYVDDKVAVMFADDLHDAANFLASTPRKWNTHDSTSSQAREDWDLGAGWAGALAMANTGWSQGALNLANELGVIPPTTAEADHSYDVAGAMPNVGLYCAGDPMHMFTADPDAGHRPIVHLVINVVCSGFIKASAFANYGTAIAAMINQIEINGRSVELDVVFVDNLRYHTALMGWKVKRAGDPADLAAIAYSIGHPAAFRRLGFAFIERTPKSNEVPGYGRCGGLTVELAERIGAKDAFLLGGIGESYGSCDTKRGALRFAAEQINKAAKETLVVLEGEYA